MLRRRCFLTNFSSSCRVNANTSAASRLVESTCSVFITGEVEINRLKRVVKYKDVQIEKLTSLSTELQNEVDLLKRQHQAEELKVGYHVQQEKMKDLQILRLQKSTKIDRIIQAEKIRDIRNLLDDLISSNVKEEMEKLQKDEKFILKI